MSPFAYSMASTALALIVVLGLAWLVLRLLRGRLMGRAGSAAADQEALQFVRALPLGPKERVVLMDYRGERWMLGVTAGGISVLGRWAQGSEMPPAEPPLPAVAPDTDTSPAQTARA